MERTEEMSIPAKRDESRWTPPSLATVGALHLCCGDITARECLLRSMLDRIWPSCFTLSICTGWVGGWRGGGGVVLLEWLTNGFSMMIVPTESLHFQAGGSDDVIAVHQT